jgi:DNA polymerase
MNHLETNLKALIAEYEACTKCPLGDQRIAREGNLVFGEGPMPTDLCIVGESPGPQEEREARPFFPDAPSGKILDSLLSENGLSRKKIFITNAVLCAPLSETGSVMDSTEKKKIFGSTLDDNGAIHQCNSRLKEVLSYVNPKVVVTLGAGAYHSLLGQTPRSITAELGWQSTAEYPFRIFVSYHPSFYIRKKSWMERNTKEGTAEYDKALDDVERTSNLLREHWKQITAALHD